VINHEEYGGAYNCNDQTIYIQSSDTRHSEGIEKPTTNNGTHNSKQNVEDYTFTGPIDKLAGDKSSDQTQHDPGYN
jgi:hypothetical protein